jgi:hypothetical protein
VKHFQDSLFIVNLLTACTRRSTKVNPAGFFSEDVIAMTVKFTWVIHILQL